MSIIPITIYGDQILRKNAEKVESVDNQLIMNIHDMFTTMRNANGVGLAGNQVGLNKSIFTIDLQLVEGYEELKPIVMINPEIISSSEETCIIEEGCLSLPILRADVERPKAIQVKYIDTDEKEHVLETDDFFARVIQHEYDHLIGKMIPDRVSPQIKKELKKELMRIMKREVEIDYPITDRK